jgi:hypothetical protein
LSGLPPSALGDEEAKASTRVLVDVLRDVRESMTLQRRMATNSNSNAAGGSNDGGVELAFQAIIASLALVAEPAERDDLLASFLDALSSQARTRIRMLDTHVLDSLGVCGLLSNIGMSSTGCCYMCSHATTPAISSNCPGPRATCCGFVIVVRLIRWLVDWFGRSVDRFVQLVATSSSSAWRVVNTM